MINVETRILLGLCVRVHMCMCVFESLMTQANSVRVPPEIGSDCHNFLLVCPRAFIGAARFHVSSPRLSVCPPLLTLCPYVRFKYNYLSVLLEPMSVCEGKS